MAEAKFIIRKTKTTDETGFDSLKREGLDLTQHLSGAIWTDYNVHDPGITILEQLCYALTDLIYRAGFPVEDYLTDATGQIDLERLALHPPERTLPCRPTTMEDYRKVILDEETGIANIWLRKASGSAPRGLYHMALRVEEDVDLGNHAAIIDHVRRIYERHRNLGEDIGTITIVREVECELHAEIEVAGGKAPAEILAQIYYDCSRRIVGGPNWSLFEDEVKRGVSAEELFRGPLTTHGLLREDPVSHRQTEVQAADLFSIVKAVDGVENIRTLFLKRQQDSIRAGASPEWPSVEYRLHVPQEAKACRVKLLRDGRELPIQMQDLRAQYKKLQFKRLAQRRVAQDWRALFPRPHGQYRNLQKYVSAQHQVPASYGISRYGVPASAPPDRKAKAAQLKAYMYLFDQIMADFTAQLHHLRTLFSSDSSPRQSYFFQALGDDVIPGIEALYAHPPSEVLAGIFTTHDHYLDRKSRLLDYLLALYGERFTQDSLRHFNYYYTPEQAEQVMIENKTLFLKNIVEITRDRSGAFNYREAAWNTRNVSGLMRRVCLLLGFWNQESRSLTMASLTQGLRLTPHETYARMKAGTQELRLIDLGDSGDPARAKFHEIPATGEDIEHRMDELRRDLTPVVAIKNNVLSESLLRGGIDLARYRVGSLTADKRYQLVFQRDADEQWWYLGSYPDRNAAVQSANSLCRFLRRLNIESEGAHVIEHILLRPIGKSHHDQLLFPNGQDFYSCRLSVIFPAWTARCHDANFRMLAEETVRLNCPAHLYPECYWLSFEQMYAWEILSKKWLDATTGADRNEDAINAAARAVIIFLLEQAAATEKAESHES